MSVAPSIDATIKEMLYAVGGDLSAVVAMAERYGIEKSAVKSALHRIKDADEKLIPSLQTAVSDATRAPLAEDIDRKYKENAHNAANYAKAEQTNHYNHALLPRATEAVFDRDPKKIFMGLADDISSFPSRAFWGMLGLAGEGYAKAANAAFNTDFPEHFASTDMANPKGIGHDNSSIFTFLGVPAKFGAGGVKVLSKTVPAYKKAKMAADAEKASKAQQLLLDATRKGIEYGTDFGIGYLANKPFNGDNIDAGDAAVGTAFGAGFDGASHFLGKWKGKPGLLGKGATSFFRYMGDKLKEKGKNTAGAWLRPNKNQAFKNNLDLEILLRGTPDGGKSVIQKGMSQNEVADQVEDLIEKMNRQRGELWARTDPVFAKAYEGDGIIPANGPQPVNIYDVADAYRAGLEAAEESGKIFTLGAKTKAEKYGDALIDDAKNYAEGLIGNERPHWRGRRGSVYYKEGELPTDLDGVELGYFVSPHDLQKQANNLYETDVRNARARMRRGEGYTPEDLAAQNAYVAMSDEIAKTTDDLAGDVIPGYFATRRNYADWLGWQRAMNDKRREWANDFWHNLAKSKQSLPSRVWETTLEHTFPIFRAGPSAGKARQLYDLGEFLENKAGQLVVGAEKAGVEGGAKNRVLNESPRMSLESVGRTAGKDVVSDFGTWFLDNYGFAPETQEAAEAYIRSLFQTED